MLISIILYTTYSLLDLGEKMYEPPFKGVTYNNGTAINNKTGEREHISAWGRTELTKKFMDIVSAKGGSWTLYVMDLDILEANIDEPGNPCFENRFNTEISRQMVWGNSWEDAPVVALMVMGIQLMDIPDIIETYCSIPMSFESICKTYKQYQNALYIDEEES